ncbi:glycosyltransferase family 39 protein [Candidatus Woesearchaeota archaeon]|nr:glycosyltransferase family 39 protein [Candidatus Woesearchaeota archaeon]
MAQIHKKENLAFYLMLSFVFLIFLSLSIIYAFILNTDHDEVEFFYSSYRLYEGGERIHLDTFSRIPQVIYYVYGPVFYFFGPRILYGRLFSVLLSCFVLFFTYEIIKELTKSKWFGLLSLFILTSTNFILQIFSSGLSLALPNLFIVFSLYCIIKFRNPFNYYFSCLVMTIAVLTRQNLVLLFLVLLVYVLFEKTSLKNKIISIFLSFFTGLFILSNVLFKDWRVFFSQVLGIVFPRLVEFSQNHPNTGSYPGYFSFLHFIYYFISDVNRLPLFFVLSVFLFFFFFFDFQLFKKTLLSRKEVLLIFFMFVLNYLLHKFGWNASTTKYVMYSVILWVIIISVLLKAIYDSLNNFSSKKIFFLFLITLVFSGFFLMDRSVITNPFTGETDLSRIDQVSNFLNELTRENDKIVILGEGTLHVLFESNRKTYAPLSHSYFVFTNSPDSEQVKRFGFYNVPMLKAWIDESDLVLIPEDKEFLKEREPLSYQVFEDARIAGKFKEPVIIEDAIPEQLIRSEDNNLEIYFKKEYSNSSLS